MTIVRGGKHKQIEAAAPAAMASAYEQSHTFN